jgi:hypothetical protein
VDEMKGATILTVGLLAASLALAGCNTQSSPRKPAGGGDTGSAKDAGGKDHDGPHGKGPNGGVVFDLGKYHAEFTVDHDKKECAILILGADEKTITPVAAKELTLTTKEAKTKDGKTVPPMTIKLVQQGESGGKASKFVGTDTGLGNVADFEGTVLGEIDGKPSQGRFKE